MTTPPKPPPMRAAAVPPKPLLSKIPKPPGSPQAAARQTKVFQVQAWSGQGEGEKVIIYGGSGVGKTSLTAMLPGVVFVGLDDGARKIGNPLTGEPVLAIQGVQSLDDMRDVLHSPTLLDGHKALAIDTVTKLEEIAEPFLFANYKHEKGHTVKSIEGYGWGKGYKHLQDAMRLILADCDALIRKGKHIIMLAQENAISVPNVEGADFLQAGPKLTHTKQYSVRQDYCEWADHVLRIGYLETNVIAAEGAKSGKLAATDKAVTRCVYASEARHFFAKTRTLKDPVISFESQQDDSLWRMMFPQEYQ